MDYLLDTNILSAYYHEDHPQHVAAKDAIGSLDKSGLQLVSVVTLAEIDYGVQLAEDKSSKYVQALRDRADIIRVRAKLPVTVFTSESYARLKAAVAKLIAPGNHKKNPRFVENWIRHTTGKELQIDENDLWIASQAIERDVTLVTIDKRFMVFKEAVSDFKLLLVSPP